MERIFDVMMPVAIFGSFGLTLYYFTKVLTDYILKKKMVEKGYVDAESQSIFKKQFQAENRYSSLKWGLLILAAGIGLIIIDSTGVDPESPLPYGIFCVALSLGFLSYYFIVKKDNK